MYGQGNHQTHQERPFRCDQCTQSFNRNHDLKRHKRIHLAVKPFPCTSCDKSFSRKDALKRHRLVKGCDTDSGMRGANKPSSQDGTDPTTGRPRSNDSNIDPKLESPRDMGIRR
ncbi:unnamed protein product [Parascedosporium putredinis]|uniref:C2H2-type domain-containing protein n=1 Tax=Parascedosporium putredinis TaxID=1442378 RepID=A0A9P1GVP8_9PEZI|nr:unnamed protein product [Parascedosporium putredinis]CAI7988203.1 unnamed protein product [Parascedosporium putredinis]